ncbi:putative membrane protein YedE/YeeE [Methylohalomonas lacus]|uniref:Membrane protein YedE/YeeE n=1 Tax=Methylohalomonas lacus TaxID=398773 RepID=A0AAE3HMQ0_9GAMM|nr:YeeE/YedE family protein [Methylohalomonas lacus]MCS3904006.1 putative membrane protein YedE/YeeE [Methylohalomonas lacus]
MTEFTPLSAVAGGLLIGLAATALLLFNGRIAGISGLFHGLLHRDRQPWQILFLAGLVVGAGSFHHLFGSDIPQRADFPLVALLGAGFLVGLGTRLGSGCTSGHGVCGIGRRSARSVVATAIFMVTAVLATAVSRHWLGLY